MLLPFVLTDTACLQVLGDFVSPPRTEVLICCFAGGGYKDAGFIT